jgi:hypothetical protein
VLDISPGAIQVRNLLETSIYEATVITIDTFEGDSLGGPLGLACESVQL